MGRAGRPRLLDGRTDDLHRRSRKGRDRESNIFLAGAAEQFVQLMRAELWLIPIADAPRTPGERMLAGEPWVVLHEIAVQHILRKFPGPAKGLNPVKVGDGFDFRRHRAGGLLVPEYDVADE